MRELVRSGLKAVGLSTRREADNLRTKLQSRERECEGLRKAVKASRKRESGLTDRVAALERLAGSLKQDVRRWKDQTEAARGKERVTAKAGQQATVRAGELAAVIRDQKARLETAETALLVSRDQLMATETKLDLLEAAINLLDRRTRGAQGSQS